MIDSAAVYAISADARDNTAPGTIQTLSGKKIDLLNPTWDDMDIEDIAWALSKQVRYNGHIPYDYTVARHSVIMSYYVPEEHALEALLHDAGEAYCGDIIYPIKRLYPELDDFEDHVTAVIMNKFNYGKNVQYVMKSIPGSRGLKGTALYRNTALYRKSPTIAAADLLIYKHECSRFGRGGQYVKEMHEAERSAMKKVGLNSLMLHGMLGDRDAFLQRFYDLKPGSAH